MYGLVILWSFPTFEPISCSISSFNCCFLTCIDVCQETCKVVWYSHLFKNFPQFVVIHRVKGFCIVREAEVGILLELSCRFYDPADAGNLISGSSAFSKSSLYIWNFSVQRLQLNPNLKDFVHYLASMWNECNSAVVWTFFGVALFLELKWKLIFSSPVTTAEVSRFAGILNAALSQHHLLGFEIAQLEFHHLL